MNSNPLGGQLVFRGANAVRGFAMTCALAATAATVPADHAGAVGRSAWRVPVLNSETAGTGLFMGSSCLFTIPNYWTYGQFEPRECCELPGKLFRARASGAQGARHVYYAPGLSGLSTRYRMADETLYAAWRVRAPGAPVPGAQVSLVRPQPGPWEVWCGGTARRTARWHVRTQQNGKWIERRRLVAVPRDAWLDVQVAMEPQAITLQLGGRNAGRSAHDAYQGEFLMTFGGGQTDEGGAEVASEYRETFFHNIPYPYDPARVPDGPEDVRPEDDSLCYMVNEATPEEPRNSEGDLIELKDGRLLLVWSDYYGGTGWDGSPARLAGRTSADGGQTWSPPFVVVSDEHGGNVMSASLLRASDGDLLLAYYGQLPGTKARGMALRRSPDEGVTWSDPVTITPDNGNRHVANNACLRMLDSGRTILPCREYVNGIRWPYCLYSDDGGRTWAAGQHVPDPGLTPEQRSEQNVNEPCVAQLADGRLLMTMRTTAGGQYFSYSSDEGATWTRPALSPLRGACSPAAIHRIPRTGGILAIWTYGFAGRTPLVSAVSQDGGNTWEHLKLIEQSQYHGYGYTSITFGADKVYLTYMHYPLFQSLMRFEVEPGYIDQRLTVLPIAWFYRDVPA